MAITSEFFFPSSDGKTLIHVNQWTPSERRILGVVQIAHGVAEYGARYAPFARFLCGHGFVVVANDHLGHGQSLIPGGPMVYLGEKDGWWNVVDDMECLRSRVAKVFPDRPYFLFGHSMGVPGSPGIGKTHHRMRLAEGLPSTFRACLHKTPLSVPRACFRQECVSLFTVCVSSQDASVCVLCLFPIGVSLFGTVSVCLHKTR